MSLLGADWFLMRDKTLTAFSGDADAHTLANWPAAAAAHGNAAYTCPGQIWLEGAAGFSFVVLLATTDGVPVISSTATFSYRVFERFADAVANDAVATQERTVSGPVHSDGVVGRVFTHVSSKSQELSKRRVTVLVTTAFGSLPSASETHFEIWARHL